MMLRILQTTKNHLQNLQNYWFMNSESTDNTNLYTKVLTVGNGVLSQELSAPVDVSHEHLFHHIPAAFIRLTCS